MNNNPPNPPCNTDLTNVERLYPAALKRLVEQTELIVELETKLAAMQQPVHADEVETDPATLLDPRLDEKAARHCLAMLTTYSDGAFIPMEPSIRSAIEFALSLVSNRSGEGRQDFSRLTLRHNIETILRQWRDAHPNTLLDKIMSAIPRVSNRSGVEILDWLADHSNLELCCAPVEGDLSEEEWQVHRVNGGYNDREWNLVGRGLTPLNALQQARTSIDTEKEK